MWHEILGSDFVRQAPAVSAQSCVKYQMGGSRFDEASLTLRKDEILPSLRECHKMSQHFKL